MPAYIVADPGSCWMGKKQYGFELIAMARDAGADAVKFQLFDGTWAKNGNIVLPFDLFQEFYAHGKLCGIEVTASVFTARALDEIFKYTVPFVKFSYSMQGAKEWIEACVNIGKKVVVSSDPEKVASVFDRGDTIKLFCDPTYPVKYQLDFEGAFPPFHGFSDHTRGEEQAMRAKDYGATWFEKHIKLMYSDITCPDATFAMGPKAFTAYCKDLKR